MKKSKTALPDLLPDILRKSANLYPDNIAVRYDNEEISYQEINLLSDRLYFCLRNKGVKIGKLVGIYIDKSIDFIVSIFGILKAGGCYVPFDPLAPVERQLYIINDCSLEYLIITSKKFYQLHQILTNNRFLKYIFVMDIDRKECKESYKGVDTLFKDDVLESKENGLTPQIENNDLAYILYTSGSTGRPKGVMISHRASLAFIDWAYEYFEIGQDERIAAVSPFHFDLSIFDIFVTIKSGATIYIVPQGMCSFPPSLTEFIEGQKITTLYSVPSILIKLVLYGDLKKRDLSALRRILFAGEVFPAKYLRELMNAIPRAKYYNLYGPTETNVCTFYPVTDMPEPGEVIPIGRACEGTEVFVLDEAGNLVKEEEIGELYVSGPTLIQGYWNDPQKTEGVLLKNFLHSPKFQNVYKTGDLARFNKNGNLEFHGRKDNMIKSRGYRIELAEIESVLYGHPLIKEVVAVPIPDDQIGSRIKVVIVSKGGCSITKEEVSSFCSQRLPLYMIPEIITFTDFIPKTPTGKTDREKLKILK